MLCRAVLVSVLVLALAACGEDDVTPADAGLAVDARVASTDRKSVV